MKPILLTQRIICPDRVFEFSVLFRPEQWYRGPFPTSVSLEGEVSEEVLENLVSYALIHGWRWDEERRRFYPMDNDTE